MRGGRRERATMLPCADLLFISYVFRPIVTFSLNALSGRHHKSGGVWVGDWDSSNAYDFINYTISKGYQIDSWEFGMEQ